MVDFKLLCDVTECRVGTLTFFEPIWTMVCNINTQWDNRYTHMRTHAQAHTYTCTRTLAHTCTCTHAHRHTPPPPKIC